ncbi:uncharacterized protein LOC111088040 [Limulus polyphemus]|uniref:Uncharacterized protein LOC111088040 n=1 Tax=Limulus polyphemus TaxID=6850 RepID=A0ABM1T9J6_LIMPO|nr:uncharacterized protein LOC111088040 [Limulus polyphemus]
MDLMSKAGGDFFPSLLIRDSYNRGLFAFQNRELQTAIALSLPVEHMNPYYFRFAVATVAEHGALAFAHHIYESLFHEMDSSGGTHRNSDLSSEERKDVIYTKHESPSSHEGTCSEVSESHVQGQLVGYLEVEDSDINSDESIICLPRQIEIDGEHVILTHDEHGGEIIVVVSTSEEDIQSQTVNSGNVMLGGDLENFSEGRSIGYEEHSMEGEYMFQIGESLEATECSIACSKTPGTFVDNQNVIECHDDINNLGKTVIEDVDNLTIANNKESLTKKHSNAALSKNLKNNSEKMRGNCSSSAAMDLSFTNTETNLSSEDCSENVHVRENEDLCEWIREPVVSKSENKSVPYSIQEQEFIQSESYSNYEQELHKNNNFVSGSAVVSDAAGFDNLIFSKQAANDEKCTQHEQFEPLDIVVDDKSKKSSESELKEYQEGSSTENETESKKDLPVGGLCMEKDDLSLSSSKQLFLTSQNRTSDTVKSGLERDKPNQCRSTNVITFAHSSQKNVYEEEIRYKDYSKLDKEIAAVQDNPFFKVFEKDEILSSDVEQIKTQNSEKTESVMDKIDGTVSDKGDYLKQTSTKKDGNSKITCGETLSTREENTNKASTELVCDSKGVKMHSDTEEKRKFSNWLKEASEMGETRNDYENNVSSNTPFNILDEKNKTGKIEGAEYKDQEIRKATTMEIEAIAIEGIEAGEKVNKLEIENQLVADTTEKFEDKLSENEVFKLKTNMSGTEDNVDAKEKYEAEKSVGEKQVYESVKLTENSQAEAVNGEGLENATTSNRTEDKNCREFCVGKIESLDKNIKTFSYSNKDTVEETLDSIEAEQKDTEKMVVIYEDRVSEIDDQARENVNIQSARRPDNFQEEEELEENSLVLEKQSATVKMKHFTAEKNIESNKSISEEHENILVENIKDSTVSVQNFEPEEGKIEENVKCVEKWDIIMTTESHKSEEIAENMFDMEQKTANIIDVNIENKTTISGNVEFSEKQLVENIESTLENNSILEEQAMTGNSLNSAKAKEDLVGKMEYITRNRQNVETEENLKDVTGIKGFKTTKGQAGNKISENLNQETTFQDTRNGVSETERTRSLENERRSQNEQCLEKQFLRTFSEKNKCSETSEGKVEMSVNAKNSTVNLGTTTTENLAAVTVLQSLKDGTDVKKGTTENLWETQKSENLESDKSVPSTTLVEVQLSPKLSEDEISSQSIITSEKHTLIYKLDKTDDVKDTLFATTKEMLLTTDISDNHADGKSSQVEPTMKEQSLDDTSENIEHEKNVQCAPPTAHFVTDLSNDVIDRKSVEIELIMEKQQIWKSENLETDKSGKSAQTTEQSVSEIFEGNLSDRSVLTTGIKEQQSVAEDLENERNIQKTPTRNEHFATEMSENLINDRSFQNVPTIQEQSVSEISEYIVDGESVQITEKYYVTPISEDVKNTSTEITSSKRQSVSDIKETSQCVWAYQDTPTTLKQSEVSKYLKDGGNVEVSPKEKQSTA